MNFDRFESFKQNFLTWKQHPSKGRFIYIYDKRKLLKDSKYVYGDHMAGLETEVAAL